MAGRSDEAPAVQGFCARMFLRLCTGSCRIEFRNKQGAGHLVCDLNGKPWLEARRSGVWLWAKVRREMCLR